MTPGLTHACSYTFWRARGDPREVTPTLAGYIARTPTRASSGATAIEYSLIARGIALAIIATGYGIGPKLIMTFSSVSTQLNYAASVGGFVIIPAEASSYGPSL